MDTIYIIQQLPLHPPTDLHKVHLSLSNYHGSIPSTFHNLLLIMPVFINYGCSTSEYYNNYLKHLTDTNKLLVSL